MAKTYEHTAFRRFGNRMMTLMLRYGLGPRSTYLLTVAGRKTGEPQTTPVTLVEEDDGRYLVAAYGVRQWVRNVREAGQVQLRRGSRSERLDTTELGAEEAAPVLKRYLNAVPIVTSYFDVAKDAPVEDFQTEADHHPVFKLGEPAS